MNPHFRLLLEIENEKEAIRLSEVLYELGFTICQVHRKGVIFSTEDITITKEQILLDLTEELKKNTLTVEKPETFNFFHN